MSDRSPIVCSSLLCLFAILSACGPRQDASQVATPGPAAAPGAPCPVSAAGRNARITNAVEESLAPRIAWNGETFVLTWRDLRGRHPSIFVAQVDRSGSIVSAEARIPGDAAARDHSLAVDADEGHLVFLERGRARSVRLGDEPRDPQTIDEEISAPVAGPLGAVAWVKKGNLLFRTDLPPPAVRDHRRRVADPRFSRLAEGGIFDVALGWNGEVFAVVWSELAGAGRRVMLQRVDNRGTRIGGPSQVSIAGGMQRRPRVAWTEDGWAISWISESRVPGGREASFRVFLALVPELTGGPRFTRELDLETAVDEVSMASAGGELGLAWVENLEPMGSAVFFARLDLEGNPLGEPIRVSDDQPLNCGRPDLAWAGDGYGVTWHDDREPAGSEIFFSFLACGEEPPPEEPGDAGPGDEPDAGLPDEEEEEE